jgi:hypothetical protein
MTRENARSKSHRYLVEGRVVLELVAHDMIRGHVRGDGAVHTARTTSAAGAAPARHADAAATCSPSVTSLPRHRPGRRRDHAPLSGPNDPPK